MDVVFPNNNEEKLVAMAKRLGTSELMLVYPLSDRNITLREAEVTKLKCRFGILVRNQQDVQKAKRFSKNLVAYSRPWVYDDKRVKFVINMEDNKREDFVHHRNSGLNQVFIKKAIRHGKTLLVNASLLFSDRQELMLGRMMQNNRFFRKYKPDVIVVSGATTPLDMRSERDLVEILKL